MSPFRKFLISAFIMLNILAMVRIHAPLGNKVVGLIYRPVDSYLSFFSIFQSWTMFSPNPSRTNVYVTAHVKFEDGTSDTYMLPRNTDLNFADRYTFGERFRVITEAIRRDDGNFMWRDVSKFAMRQVRNKNFNKIPVKVDLVRHWHITPEIKKRFIPHQTESKVYTSYKFHTQEVL